MIVIIDNYDSFVHNLARYAREAGAEVCVFRNDEKTAAEFIAMAPSGVILSPGPKAPKDAGVCLELIAQLNPATPLLGVCLGHQALAEAFGGETVRAETPLHGEATMVRHNGDGVFKDIPSPTPAGRYHSLIAAPENGELIETAWADDGALMGLAHPSRPWFGVQFHPESLLTPCGRKMIKNFTAMCREERAP